jgi:hypothetical protein
LAVVNVRYVTVSICETPRSGHLRRAGYRLIRIVLCAASAPALLSSRSRPARPRPGFTHVSYTTQTPLTSEARLISSALEFLGRYRRNCGRSRLRRLAGGSFRRRDLIRGQPLPGRPVRRRLLVSDGCLAQCDADRQAMRRPLLVRPAWLTCAVPSAVPRSARVRRFASNAGRRPQSWLSRSN